MNMYAIGFCNCSATWHRSWLQYYVLQRLALVKTQLFEAGDTFKALLKPSFTGDDEVHVSPLK